MTIRARLAERRHRCSDWWRTHWYHQLARDLDTLGRARVGIDTPTRRQLDNEAAVNPVDGDDW